MTATLNSQPLPLDAFAQCGMTYEAPKSDGYFAFARIKGELRLVQVSHATPASALMAVDVKIFRHEFISIFRFVESRSFHPTDISILETIDSNSTRYEEDNGTVFLSRELMDRMSKMSDPRRMMMYTSQTRRLPIQRQRQR